MGEQRHAPESQRVKADLEHLGDAGHQLAKQALAQAAQRVAEPVGSRRDTLE